MFTSQMLNFRVEMLERVPMNSRPSHDYISHPRRVYLANSQVTEAWSLPEEIQETKDASVSLVPLEVWIES